jgi:hypothetical protein
MQTITPNTALGKYVLAYTTSERTKDVDGGTVTIYSGSATASDPYGNGDFKFMDRVKRAGNFKAAWGWNEEPYRMVYIDFAQRAVVTYCEGDVSVAVADTDPAFKAELRDARTYYDSPRCMDADYMGMRKRTPTANNLSPFGPSIHADPEGQALGLNDGRCIQ